MCEILVVQIRTIFGREERGHTHSQRTNSKQGIGGEKPGRSGMRRLAPCRDDRVHVPDDDVDEF